jgi:CheY-like chemotaxis protein
MTKILLVEDDKNLREIYGTRLYAEGYDIVSAGDGEQALAMAIKERPSLIISDVMMPKISGFDMLDILRSTTETKNIKVIMMTALSSEDQRQRGEALGADRYLVKSQVGIEDVVRTVHEVLADAPGLTPPTTAAMPARQATPVPVAPRPTMSSVPPAPSAQPSASPVAGSPLPQQSGVLPMPAASQQTIPPSPIAGTPMPQPTAPFSTNRPANLGQRIIQPIARDEPANADISSKLAEELSSVSGNSATPPMPQSAPAMPQAQQPVPIAPPVAPTQPTPPQPTPVDPTYIQTPPPAAPSQAPPSVMPQ